MNSNMMPKELYKKLEELPEDEFSKTKKKEIKKLLDSYLNKIESEKTT